MPKPLKCTMVPPSSTNRHSPTSLGANSFIQGHNKHHANRLPIMAKTLTLITTDLSKPSVPFPVYHEPEVIFVSPICPVPEYYEPSEMMTAGERPVHKLVDQVSRTPGRMPSPQPTHFDSPPLPYKNGNGNGHRVLRSATVGYIAPEFAGKTAQKVEGELAVVR
jgi:hypothetical protein